MISADGDISTLPFSLTTTDRLIYILGYPGLFYVKVNEDMISYSGDIVEVETNGGGIRRA